jgi:t-SNARE complex subunit (syntaxin)
MTTDAETIAAKIESLNKRIDNISERVANGTYDELKAPIHRLARTWRERPWLIILAAIGAVVTVAVIVTAISRLLRANKD